MDNVCIGQFNCSARLPPKPPHYSFFSPKSFSYQGVICWVKSLKSLLLVSQSNIHINVYFPREKSLKLDRNSYKARYLSFLRKYIITVTVATTDYWMACLEFGLSLLETMTKWQRDLSQCWLMMENPAETVLVWHQDLDWIVLLTNLFDCSGHGIEEYDVTRSENPPE